MRRVYQLWDWRVRRFLGLSLSLMMFTAGVALAHSVRIACEGETITIPGWGSGTMNLAFDGGSPGTLVVKGPHVDFKVPASSHKFESPLRLSQSTGRATRRCCCRISRRWTLALPVSCLPNTTPTRTGSSRRRAWRRYLPAPLQPVHASATITFMRDPDMQALGPLVQMKLSYLDKSADPTGKLTIDLMPKDCKVIRIFVTEHRLE